MYVDTEVRFIREPDAKLNLGESRDFIVSIDFDYISDYDDVIHAVEEELYTKHDVVAYCYADFEIKNASDILEELGII
jgi:hypothetical protein